MAANTITHGRLRRLAELRPQHGMVLSVFYNLDPSEFATPAARATEANSVVTAAAREGRGDRGPRARRPHRAAGRRRAREGGAQRTGHRLRRHARARGVRVRARRRPRGVPAAAPDRVARDRRRPRVRRAARAQRFERALVRAAREPQDRADLHGHGRRAWRRSTTSRATRTASTTRAAGRRSATSGRSSRRSSTTSATRSTRCSRASSGSRSTTSSSGRPRSS